MDLFASDVWGKLGVTFDATTLQTDGYRIVAEEERGAIDNEANVKYQNVSAKLDYNPTDRVNLFFRAGVFDEERNNGKIGEVNDTNWKYGSGGVRAAVAPTAATSKAGCSSTACDFFQNTFAVPAATPPRSQSNLSLEKNVPTNAIGTMVQWSRAFQLGGRTHVMSAGTDFRWIDGDSDELTYALATGLTPLIHRVAGGTQRFVRRVRAGPDRGDAEAAADAERAHRQLAQLRRAQSRDDARDRSADGGEQRVAAGQVRHGGQPASGRALSRDTIASPSGAASARASARRRSRSSTARSASAQVLTLANETLGPERLTGEEAGVSVARDRTT